MEELSATNSVPVGTRTTLGLFLIVACATAFFALYRTDYTIDDAWITYRYAENLAEGLGFVFNPGERILGTSTPLYTLILAAGHWIGLTVPLLSKAIGFLAMLGTILGLFLLTRRLAGARAGLLAAALLVSMQVFHRVSTYGMETPLYTCLIVFSFHAYARERLSLATVLAALCLLLRLDGGAVGAALFASYLITHRRIPWSYGVLYLAFILPWFVFSQLYFETLLPQSFLAKRFHADSQLQFWMLEWLFVQAAVLTVLALLGGMAAMANRATRARSLPIAIWAAAYVVAYSFSNLDNYDWYRTPLSIPLAILASVGILGIETRVQLSRYRRALILALIVVIALLPDAFRTVDRLRSDSVNTLEQARYEAAHWLKDYLPEEAVLATGGIGHVGYFTKNYILDASGLVSPQVVKSNPPAWPRFMPLIIEEHRPEYVFMAFQVMPYYLKDDYVSVHSWDTGNFTLYGNFHLLRRDPPISGMEGDQGH
jgi:hypothetical protein